MDYRMWITIPGLHLDQEARWEPLIEELERRCPALGPVIGFDDGRAQLVVSTAADGHAHATAIALGQIEHVLAEHGYAAGKVEVEPADDRESIVA